MRSKNWIIMFLCCLLSLPFLLAAFNYVVDPFGVFGHMTWYSFSETLNPRVAKTEYLEDHWDDYDSYVVGCSSTSSYPVEALNEYLGGSFYNWIVYGADMEDSARLVAYLLENDDVKNIVLNVYIDNGITCSTGEDDLTLKLHQKVSGADATSFYFDYLMADPNYAMDKLEAMGDDTWLPQTFDVFNETTGAYDKRARDIENIGDMERYLQAYPVFADYPIYPTALDATQACMEQVAVIRDLCEAAGTKLYVVCAPVYGEYLNTFSDEDLAEFYTALAQVTDYWDFTYSSVSWEPRYFYDGTHFRNDVGEMALGRMFGNDSIYIPEDFGAYVTAENVAEHVKTLTNRTGGQEDSGYTCEVPILMYHHLSEEGGSDINISTAAFTDQIRALAQAGYTAVTFDDLYDYVTTGAELPEKPVVITFDDGYQSNYDIAYPILEQYGMKATIFPIGVSVGKDTYKDTGAAITPHFGWEEAAEMVESGVISIQTHTYDMHQAAEYETGPVREGVLQMDGESEEDYMEAFRSDLTRAMEDVEAATGEEVTVLAYPFGFYTPLSQALCKELGIRATVTVESRSNTLVKGLPQCLYGMGRYTVAEISGDELLAMLEG